MISNVTKNRWLARKKKRGINLDNLLNVKRSSFVRRHARHISIWATFQGLDNSPAVLGSNAF